MANVAKAAWSGAPKELFYIGAGDNVLPTIHVRDLAGVILQTATNPPDDQYILAVDESNHTQKEIIEVRFSSLLSPLLIWFM